MDPTYYANSAEAKALHAVIDGDDEELDRVLGDMLPGELRQLARQAHRLAVACDEEILERMQ
jgi:hypothetical protein